jgi:hypothetical protein
MRIRRPTSVGSKMCGVMCRRRPGVDEGDPFRSKVLALTRMTVQVPSASVVPVTPAMSILSPVFQPCGRR